MIEFPENIQQATHAKIANNDYQRTHANQCCYYLFFLFTIILYHLLQFILQELFLVK